MPDSVLTERARYAAKKRHHPEQDHSDTKRDLAVAKAEAYLQKLLDEAPPLTDSQRSRLAELLRPARAAITAARLAELDTNGGAA